MDSRHTSALPQAAWRPSLLPAPGAAPRRGQAQPVRMLAALGPDAAPHAGAAAVSGLQSCLASLAALTFAGLGAALLLQWPPSGGALDVGSGHGERTAAARVAVVEVQAAAQASDLMPTPPAAARIERSAPHPSEPVNTAPLPPLAAPASAAITPSSGAHATSAQAGPAHAPRHASAARHRDGTAAAAKAPGGPAPLPAASTRAPHADADAEGAAPPQADSDAALLRAVMEWHEQHAPPPAPQP